MPWRRKPPRSTRSSSIPFQRSECPPGTENRRGGLCDSRASCRSPDQNSGSANCRSNLPEMLIAETERSLLQQALDSGALPSAGSRDVLLGLSYDQFRGLYRKRYQERVPARKPHAPKSRRRDASLTNWPPKKTRKRAFPQTQGAFLLWLAGSMAKIVLGRGLGALIQARPTGTSKSHVTAVREARWPPATGGRAPDQARGNPQQSLPAPARVQAGVSGGTGSNPSASRASSSRSSCARWTSTMS